MLEIKIPAQIERLDEVLEFVEAAILDYKIEGTDNKFNININIVIEEIFVNIASYAYPSGGGDITVSVDASEDGITIEFRDSGIAYDPLAKDDPDISLSASEREIGGLGIFMVKQMMDNIDYRYENNSNILTLYKNWSGSV